MANFLLLAYLGRAAATCYSAASTRSIDHEDGIVYGYSYNPVTTSAENPMEAQTLNIAYPRYSPGDDARPIFVWLHGGGFDVAQGDNTAQWGPEFCLKMAQHGFVVFNINYRRLHGYREQQHEDDQKYHHTTNHGAFRPMAVANDTRAAMRYAVLRTDLHTDTRMIAVGGDSAGAQSVLMMAYYPLFHTEGNTGTTDAAGLNGQTYNTYSTGASDGGASSTWSLGRLNTVVSMSGAMRYWGAHEEMAGVSLDLPKLVAIHGSFDTMFRVEFAHTLVDAANTLAPDRGFLTEIINGGHLPMTPWVFSSKQGGLFSFREWGYPMHPLPMECARRCGPTGTFMVQYGDLLDGTAMPVGNKGMPTRGTMKYWDHYMRNLITAMGLRDSCRRLLSSDVFV